jgi:hypothetical protein
VFKKEVPSDVTLMAKQACRMFENGVLWRIFGRERRLESSVRSIRSIRSRRRYV